MYPKRIYYEPGILDYELGKQLRERYTDVPWHPIQSHNNIEELRTRDNADFVELKKYLIIGTRKTHKYGDNQKVSDYLVPWTSSGCSAMCLYCYLVCNYNKCAYLRVYVNREEMLDKLLKRAYKEDHPKTFEIGSNSDLVLEQRITGSPAIAVETFGREGRGSLTFPTKFSDVEPFLHLAINEQAFPNAIKLYHKEQMTGRGRGKYIYWSQYRHEAEEFLRQEIAKRFACTEILYVV